MKRLVLLDRDGTINVERHYLSSPEEVKLLPGVAEALQTMRRLGLAIVVVTNQSAIGRGYFDRDVLDAIHHRLRRLLTHQGASLDAIYVCPHLPEQGCDCRKPAPGLARQAAHDLGADLRRSFVIGDKACDIELGKRVGAATFLVRTGYGAHVAAKETVKPDYTVDTLQHAADVIRSLLRSDRAAISKRHQLVV